MSKRYRFRLRSRNIQIILDKFLLLKLAKRLNGRFWGIYGLLGLGVSLLLCFNIRQDLQVWSTAFSDFGGDIRTAPYFTAGIFVSAYGLWRWRNYLTSSSKRPGIITMLITFTILGLYMVAFMPIGWNNTIETLHYAGFTLVGISMALTVLADTLLRKIRKSKRTRQWQLVRISSLLFIVTGLVITALSTARFNMVLDVALIGELLMFYGYGLWVVTKTYQGEGARSSFSRLLAKVVIID